MAIAFTAVSSSLNSGTGTSGTGNLTVGSESNRVALIGVNANGGSDALTGITDDLSNALTLVDKVAVNGGTATDWLYVYIQVAPSTGSRTYTASFSASRNWSVSAIYYSGCAQTGQPDAHNTKQVSGATSISNSITSIADNCWHIAYVSNEQGGQSAGASTTLRSSFTDPAWFDGNAAVTPAGSSTLNVSWAGGAGVGAAVSITIAPPGAVVANTLAYKSLMGVGI